MTESTQRALEASRSRKELLARVGPGGGQEAASLAFQEAALALLENIDAKLGALLEAMPGRPGDQAVNGVVGAAGARGKRKGGLGTKRS